MVSKVEAIRNLHIKVINEVEEKDLHKTLYEIEFPLIQVLARMEIEGVKINVEKIDELNKFYENKINEVQTKIEEITMVNINSPLQLSDYLFVENELPNKGIKKTTRGYSTDVTNLNKLKDLLFLIKSRSLISKTS